MESLTAKYFIQQLALLKSKTELENVQRFFRDESSWNKFMGIRMSGIFVLAKQFLKMPPEEIKELLANDYYEARMGAVSIMDFQARDKKVSPAQKKELFDLYLRHHDRINNWDLVDRSAPFVVGGYLSDKPRTILYKLAKSANVWEKRTAIVATYYFIRENEIDDTFKIAGLLINDPHDLIQKAVGSWIREAGKRDERKLISFLNKYSATMPRVTLRYTIAKLDKKKKEFYLKAKSKTGRI
jgi:3-methyladenine DNA glycosylase AlkD